MPFDWHEFLLLAYRLRNDPLEAAQRTCLGRAYYYVFNLALVSAKKHGFKFGVESGGMHKQLWAWCQKHSDPTVRNLGIYGVRMHSKRIAADYQDSQKPNLPYEVNLQLELAKDCEGFVTKYFGTPPPPPPQLP